MNQLIYIIEIIDIYINEIIDFINAFDEFICIF